MYEVWETDGTYIQGKKRGQNATKNLETAKNRAKKIKDFDHFEEPIKNSAYRKSDVVLWINDEELRPIGLIREIQ